MIFKINKCKCEVSVVIFIKFIFFVSIFIVEKFCLFIDCQFFIGYIEQRLRLLCIFMLNNIDIMVCYILVLYIIGSY